MAEITCVSADAPIAAGDPAPDSRSLPLGRYSTGIRDLRGASEPATLQREGFALVREPSAVRDFGDADEVALTYLGEVEQIVRRATGASEVFVLPRPVFRAQHHHRTYGPGVDVEGVAQAAHVDYSGKSALNGLASALQRHGAKAAPEGRMRAYTVWRALSPPPQDWPLALCDMRSVEAGDLARVDAGGVVGRRHEFYLLRHRADQRWSFYSDMTPEEVLIFLQHDSARTGVTGCPHTTFRDPACPADAAGRLSIESRAFAFFP